MVVGNGMIAKAFERFKNDDNIIVFASGVSNSREQNPENFQREIDLLEKHISAKKIIYFSTVSIFDGSFEGHKYISHKIFIENLIKEKFESYIIFRLPNVVGKTNNPNTSFNNFKNKIVNGEGIIIQKNAIRYLVDVDDLVKILPLIISSENRKCINTCFDNKIRVEKMVEIFENLLQVKANKTFIESGEDYVIDNSYFKNILKKNNILIDKEYNEKLIKKYLFNYE